MDILALVTLKLDHLAHFRVVDNSAIAGKFLLDDFEDLALVEFLRQALHGRQGLASIALCVEFGVSDRGGVVASGNMAGGA